MRHDTPLLPSLLSGPTHAIHLLADDVEAVQTQLELLGQLFEYGGLGAVLAVVERGGDGVAAFALLDVIEQMVFGWWPKCV